MQGRHCTPHFQTWKRPFTSQISITQFASCECKFLEKECFLYPSQSCFRKLRSSSDNLIWLAASICEDFAPGHHLVVVFFDPENVSDTAWRQGILQQLMCSVWVVVCLNFSATFLRILCSGLALAPLSLHQYPQEEGVPQESVLSVSLLAVAISGILNAVSAWISSSLYVGDMVFRFPHVCYWNKHPTSSGQGHCLDQFKRF